MVSFSSWVRPQLIQMLGGAPLTWKRCELSDKRVLRSGKFACLKFFFCGNATVELGEIYGGNDQLDWMIQDLEYS